MVWQCLWNKDEISSTPLFSCFSWISRIQDVHFRNLFYFVRKSLFGIFVLKCALITLTVITFMSLSYTVVCAWRMLVLLRAFHCIHLYGWISQRSKYEYHYSRMTNFWRTRLTYQVKLLNCSILGTNNKSHFPEEAAAFDLQIPEA